jgi:hypothetical protein
MGDVNDQFGELTIWVASSLVSTGEAVQNANRAAEQLGPGVSVVNDAIRATAPFVTQITAQFNAWHPLLSRLGALVKVADMLAEASFISNTSSLRPLRTIYKQIHPWIKLAWGVVSAAYRVRLESSLYLCAFSQVFD